MMLSERNLNGTFKKGFTPWNKGIIKDFDLYQKNQKRCAKCKEVKPRSDFNKSSYSNDEKQSYCKLCSNKRTREYYAKNIERMRQKIRDYGKTHREEGNERAKKYYRKIRREAISKLGGKCERCGITDIRLLNINHIDGGGRKELDEVYGGWILKFYRDIARGNRKTDDLNVLCANHNILYEYEVGRRKWKN